MLDFARFSWLTFDCYGTLIDWERGILDALRPVFAAHGRHLNDEGILELYAALEAREEEGEYQPYAEILQNIVRRMGARLVFTPDAAQVRALVDSIGDWPPFPDTVEALRRLHSRYRLAVISNVDDELFARTAQRLEVPFDAVITAAQARSYKPSPRNFELALERLGSPAARVLHVAQSLHHDVPPAKALGFSTVWVDRRGRKKGSGATPSASAQPDLVVPDLRTLAELAIGSPK
jgi:2-haloacid dehalogenase